MPVMPLHQHEYYIEKTGEDEVRFGSKFGHTIDRVLLSKPHDPVSVVKSIEAEHERQGIVT